MAIIDKLIGKVIRKGELTIVYPGGEQKTYGTPEPGGRRATVRIRDGKAMRQILRNPRLGIGEAYMDGGFSVDGDIYDFLDLVTFNARWERGGGARHAIRKRGKLRGKLDQLNWRARSKRNVAHHYDIGNRLYELFLDRDLQYTCAYFTDPANSIEQAQDDKKAHLLSKLRLEPGQRVLDIGAGWGGLALYMHQVADVDVLGITLSQEQLVVARQRAEAAGVADRVKFELMDYRDLPEQERFDRVTAIGVLEHVGPPDFETFFGKIHGALKEDGIALVHFLGRLGKPGTTDPWTAKYIFPGGYNPSLSQVVAASEKVKLISADIEQLRMHYAHTCRRWLERTRANRDEIIQLYDERFFRMWEFYLAGSITAFENGGCCNYQIQYVRDRYALPTTRDYMIEAEMPLRAGLAKAREKEMQSAGAKRPARAKPVPA
jgi:cyclopropane-fatty-acyl-phospholipid synthase